MNTQSTPRQHHPAGQRLPGLLAALLLAAGNMLLASCESLSAPEHHVPMATDIRAPILAPYATIYATNYLQEGDVVSIAFQYSTNYNTIQKIGLDGTLNLQSSGLVPAAGKSPQQLQTELTALYKDLVKDDPVMVKIIASVSSVYVAGAVTRPGKIPLERPMTVMEAVMEAGGFDPYRANLSAVLVLRVVSGKQETYRVNLKHTLQGNGEVPLYLKPFDIIQVPTKTFNF